MKDSSIDTAFCCVNPEKWTSSGTIELEPNPEKHQDPRETLTEQKTCNSQKDQYYGENFDHTTCSTTVTINKKNEESPWTKNFRPDTELARKYMKEKAATSSSQRNIGDVLRKVVSPSAPTIDP